MRIARLLLPLATAFALLALSATPALADEDGDDRRGKGRGGEGKPEFAKAGGDKWLLRNDDISVWFHAGGNGKAKPSLRVFATDADGNVSGYGVQVKRLAEYGPGADGPRRYGDINLAPRDDWNVATEDSNESLTVRMVRSEAQGIVTLVFHVSKTSPSVKFDLQVENWRWAPNSTDHYLALDIVVDKRLKQDGEDRVALDGGYVAWAPNATVKYGAVTRGVNVTGTTDEEEGGGRIRLVFDAPGGYSSLDYDPEFGVASASATERPVPAPALALAAVAVALAAVGVRRRR